MYRTDAARWRALSIRDPSANNQFVYTVKSTRIYCRPTCPARLARRANVGFCSTPTEAAALGYRACKRCKPDLSDAEDPQEKAVTKACRLIEEAIRQGGESGKLGLRLQDLAKNVGLTPRYFHKIFKDRMGVTPKEWAKSGGGVSRGESETRTQSLVLDSPPGFPAFDLDAFDFNELEDLHVGDASGFDGTDTMEMMQPAMLPLDGLDGGFDVDASMITWNTFAPDYLNEGFRIGNDKMTKLADASVAMTKTSATFEQDAAPILDTGFVLDNNGEEYVNTFG
ncbi:hypothetical protein BU23DRAFT_530449 [Bimuria novae-zelandiae CBS 107.79]|uniref:HTH araC/xylS-type domain-containing protein n=1 Tax=Bimuria novae-zelandiae CBS 107.79 TaxID=1447943 RepID=A0A6A5VEY4_9PLEO|nr:hypothetical protein BU23DRAFT_530449 [Bimuria novae-zelandiae CBS 107.79]